MEEKKTGVCEACFESEVEVSQKETSYGLLWVCEECLKGY